MHVTNEGQFIAIVSAAEVEEASATLQTTSGGEGARLTGEVTGAHPRTVIAETPYGGSRVVDMLVGDPLPRIC